MIAQCNEFTIQCDSSIFLDSSIIIVDRTEDLRENCLEEDRGDSHLTSIRRHTNAGE